MTNLIDDITQELNVLVELRACSRVRRDRVVAKILTPHGAVEALGYQRNGMRVSEIVDLLVALG